MTPRSGMYKLKVPTIVFGSVLELPSYWCPGLAYLRRFLQLDSECLNFHTL